MTVSVSEEKRTPGNRGRPRKTVPVTTNSFYHKDTATDKTTNLDFSVTAADDTVKHPESKSKPSGEWQSRQTHSESARSQPLCLSVLFADF